MDKDFDPNLFLGGSSDPTGANVEPSESSEPKPVETADVKAVDSSPTTATAPTESPLDPVDWNDLTPRERMLLDRLERVTGERLSSSSAMPADQQDSKASVPATQDYDFLAGMDIDSVLSSSENLNKLLLAVYNRALQEGTRIATENVLRTTPAVISQFTTQHMAMRERVDQFYRENPELASVKRTVAAVANEIAAEKPELQLDDLFKAAGERVYIMLGLKRGSTQTPAKNGQRSLVRPRGPSNRVQAPALQGLAAEIGDLFDIPQ